MGYSKLFSEIVMSTVWREPDKVRIVWITMLAIKDRWHIVNASLPGLADAARVSMKDCEEALKILASKDKYSRSKEYEGRRIEECDGGWLILNGEKYRNKMSLDERREYNRLKQQQYRRKSKASTVESCVQSGTLSAHTDTDTDSDTDSDTEKEKEPPYIPPLGETKNNKREKVSSTKRKTQIPEDYSPSPALLEWAAKQGYENIPDQVGAFVDFHRSKGNVFLQADLAFRTWLRNSGRFQKGGGIARKNNKHNNDKLDEFLEGEK